MSMTKEYYVPSDLAPFQRAIEQSMLPAIHIFPSVQPTSLYCSKFIGHPYLPKYKHYPKDSTGNPMKLLAQINFADLPASTTFPQEGILQFFIPYTNDFPHFKSNEEIWQHNFKVRYYPSLLCEQQLITDFSALQLFDTQHFPIQRESRMLFHIEDEPVSLMDYRFDGISSTPLSLLFNQDGRNLYDIYMENFLGHGHKIGGYPLFTRQDPRKEYPFLKKYDVLLFQIESDEENNIMWGDCGVANFFINSNDLANRDFSDVLYHWDHY